MGFEIKILFNIKEEGYLSPRLSRLRKGNKIFITTPSGNFHSGKEEAFWIASGTGIAPFVSMYRAGLGNNKTLIQKYYFSRRGFKADRQVSEVTMLEG